MISDFRRYWTAEVTSTFGSMFTTTAIGIVAVRVFDASAGTVGIITAAAAVPALAYGLLAGAVADRLRRPRRALMACDAIAALAVAALGVGVVTGVASVWWLVIVTLVLGTVVTVVEPV
jgi:MFS family permease